MTRTRRHFLRASAALSLTALAARRARLVSAQALPPQRVLGISQGGEPLVLHHLADGPIRVLILGGQHGGPEVNTVYLAEALREHFEANLHELPPGVGLDFLPVANPDGVAMDSRQFLSGVDPNRNWGGTDWQPDAWDSNAVFRPGLGGPEPFSEVETRALADWVLQTRPALVVNYHSAGNFMFGAGDLGQAYQEASGYWRPNAAAGSPSPLTYRATGSMNPWLRQNDIEGIFVELSTPTSNDFGRNLAGLRAALEVLAP